MTPTPTPVPRLTLDCPWGQLEEIGEDGLEVGRESPSFRGGRIAALDQISRHHARLFYEDGVLHVDDLDSYNGTYLDGARVTPGKPVAVSRARSCGWAST